MEASLLPFSFTHSSLVIILTPTLTSPHFSTALNNVSLVMVKMEISKECLQVSIILTNFFHVIIQGKIQLHKNKALEYKDYLLYNSLLLDILRFYDFYFL